MKVLITGACGYIGSTLVPHLCGEHQITGVDACIYNNQGIGHSLSHLMQFELMDCTSRRFLRELPKYDAIVHLAAIVGQPACDKNGYLAWAINTGVVDSIVKSLSPNQKLIFANTNSGYGLRGEAECHETDELHPVSTYGLSKVAAEKIATQHSNCCSFRFATVFGLSPRMRYDLMVNRFIWEILNNKEISIFNPYARRNFVHIKDACEAIKIALSQGLTGIFNCGNPDLNMTKVDLAAEIFDYAGIESNINIVEGEDPDKRDYVVNNDKILKHLKFRYGIEAAVEELRGALPGKLDNYENACYL